MYAGQTLVWMTLSSTCLHLESTGSTVLSIQSSHHCSVVWCELHINTSKTKEVMINFRRKAPLTAPVNIQGLDIEIVEDYKYLGVHLNHKLDWTHNTDVLYKKGQVVSKFP